MKQKIIISLFALFLFFTIGAVISTLYIKDNTAEMERIIEMHEVEQVRMTLLNNLKTVQADLYSVNTSFERDFDSIINSVLTLD